jgi:hypothetical protein
MFVGHCGPVLLEIKSAWLREGLEPITPPSQETGEVCSLCVLVKRRTTFKLPRVREWRTT